jgi:phenylacetate 2-hydroxylase
MQPLTAAFSLLTIGFFLIRWLHATDVPKIKNLPEPRGIPIFGNLIQLGNQHAKRAAAWAKQLGPVFQVRMGNRVRPTMADPHTAMLTL